jgi:UDP-N-acetylmuramoylalanine--D-glutamate ligase
MSCARYLAKKQQPFSVVDSRVNPPSLQRFKSEFPAIKLSLGEISDEALSGASELLVSPGISLGEPAIAKAVQAGVLVCGDIDLFRREAAAPIVAITGSNGKTTVTTLLGKMIEQSGKTVAVGGNIGVPALDLLEGDIPDFYVLELSSFQLERSEPLNAELATVLNISADHMDRYSGIASYHTAKHKIFRGCKQVVINRADPLSRPLLNEKVKVWSFGLDKPDFNGFGLLEENGEEYLAFQFETLMPVAELKMAGRHNVENSLASLALGRAIGLPFKAMLEVLREFSGLPHRCQFIGELSGVRFYNDSKGTNVGATVAAINGFSAAASSTQKIVLIAGGEGKGADFSELATAMKTAGRSAVLIGEAATEMEALLTGLLDIQRASSLSEAVIKACNVAESGDLVLLSPACASFDMFKDYQQRGDDFCTIVTDLIAREGA